jgi:hypothetical protein
MVGSGDVDPAEGFAPPPVIATVEPERDLVAYFDSRQARFRDIYQRLAPSFGGIQ